MNVLSKWAPLATKLVMSFRKIRSSDCHGKREALSHFSALSDEEAFFEVKEALGKSSLKEDERAALQRLLDVMASCIEAFHALPAEEAIEAFESKTRVETDSTEMSLRDALSRIPQEAQRLQRSTLENSVALSLAATQSPYVRRLEAVRETRERWGLSRTPAPEHLEQAQEFLKDTDDAYRDLLSYGLRKTDGKLSLASARRHDLLFARNGLWLTPALSTDWLLTPVKDWLSAWGFSPEKVAASRASQGGLDEAFDFLQSTGWAQHPEFKPQTIPHEMVMEAFSILFSQILLDEAWLRRNLGFTNKEALDTARWAAFHRTVRMREWAARLPWEGQLLNEGAGNRQEELFIETMAESLRVEFPKGLALQMPLQGITALNAHGLAANLHDFCQQRFNEDYWRNPAAATWLKRQYSLSACETPETLSQLLCGQAFSLAPGARNLVALMGA